MDAGVQVKGMYKEFLIRNSNQVYELFDKLYKYRVDTSIVTKLLFLFMVYL